MPVDELVRYILEQLEQGHEPFVIRQALGTSGWNHEDIEAAFQQAEMERYRRERSSASQMIPPVMTSESANSSVRSDSSLPEMEKTADVLVVTPAVVQPVVSPISGQRQSRRKLIGGIVAVVLLFAVVAGGVWGYFNVWLGPDMVMQRMAEKMTMVTSGTYEGEFKVRAKVKKPMSLSALPGQSGQVLGTAFPKVSDFSDTPEFGLTMKLSGMFDNTRKDTPKSETSLTFSLDGETGNLLIGKNVLGLDVKTVEKTVFFFRLRDIPDLGAFDLSTFKDQWIKFDLKELESQYGWKVEQLDKPLSAEQEAKAQEIVKETKALLITQKLGTETLDGFETFHYAYEIDKDQLVEMIVRLSAVQGDLASEKEVQQLKEIMKDLGPMTGELWIDTSSWYLRRMTLEMSVDDNSDEYEGTVSLDIKMAKFNEPVDVVLPTDALTIPQVMERVQSTPIYQQQFGMARDAQRRADMYALSTAVYMYAVEHNGSFPEGIPTGEDQRVKIGKGAGQVNLEQALVPTYMSTMPRDPLLGTDEDSGYWIYSTPGGRVVLQAFGETGEMITVER